MSNRKKWSSAVKFEIVLKILKGEKTLNEICKSYDVAPSQVHAWKKDFLESGPQLFERKEKSVVDTLALEKKEQTLYETIGQLTVERDFLKKAWGKFHEKTGKN
jgi:transposase